MARNPLRSLFSYLAADLLLPLLLLRSMSAVQVPEILTLDDPFQDPYKSNLRTLGNASVYQGTLQLTRDTRDDAEIVNQYGRALFPTPYKIWEDDHQFDLAPSSSLAAGQQKKVISFNTSFEFRVFREADWIAGEGLAFIITSNGDSMPTGSEGQYLGLTNVTTDGNATNQLVAVEFDSFKQSYDPDDNHVGLDINSVVSRVTRSLSDFNITISSPENTFYKAWIDYSGEQRHIYVYVAPHDKPKPPTPVLNARLDLSQHLPHRSYFGFAASTGMHYELNSVRAWSLTVEILPEDVNQIGWMWFLRVGVPLLGVTVAAPGVAVLVNAQKKKAKKGQRLVGALRLLPGTPREFQYRVLKEATNNFDEKNRLGQGGFGVVYRGVVPGENLEVAVKKFSRKTMQRDFLAELTIINRLRHKHLVRLLGWCHEKGKLLLVYDYMPNGSLDAHLFNALPGRHLPWDCRYRVLAGVASALHYLHNEYDQKVVHRDLKASNIMLDSAFNARLGDFGLARTIDNGRTSYTEVELNGVPGTMGYIAHECFHTGKATLESDVFGFGAVVLEVVCGRRPHCDIGGFRFLADWVWKLHREGAILDAVDPLLGGNYAAEEAERLLRLGLACNHPNPGDRPKALAVLQIICHSAPAPDVPPFRPTFVWPSTTISIDDVGEETTMMTTGRMTQTASLFHGLRIP